MFPCDDHDGRACHDDDVHDEEEVGNAVPYCKKCLSAIVWLGVVQVSELISPLCHDAQRIFEKGNDNQEATNCWYISIPGFN
jgi:hypothetical protein